MTVYEQMGHDQGRDTHRNSWHEIVRAHWLCTDIGGTKQGPLKGVTVVWLRQSVGPLPVGPGFIPVLKLVFWNPLVLEGYLAQTLLTPLRKFYPLREDEGVWWGEGGRSEGEEGELGQVCKIRKD